MKKRENEILIYLLKNSKLSDREIAKKLKTSQSTITRTRHKLEKKFINSYTIVPDLANLDIRLIAFTFANCTKPTPELMKTINEFLEKQSNIIFAGHGEGMKKTGIFISFHKNFTDYTEYCRKIRLICKGFAETVESFIVPTDKLLRTLNMSKAVEALLNNENEKKRNNNKKEYSEYYKRKIMNSS